MKNVEILQAVPQQAWGWPGIVNFILGGAGTGFYLFSFVVMVLEEGAFAMSKQIPYGLIAPILVALGFLALTTDAGHPLRGFYLFRNLRWAWLSRETFFFSIFVPVAILDWVLPSLYFRILSVATALALMISQGLILYQIRAITIWNRPIMALLFISSAFASGGGVVLLIGGLTRSRLSQSTIVLEMIALSANLVIWLVYLYWFRSTAFWEATEKLRRPFGLIITVGLGHILPLVVLFLLAVWAGSEARGPFLIETVSSLAIFVGVIVQKKNIVLGASHMKVMIIRTSND